MSVSNHQIVGSRDAETSAGSLAGLPEPLTGLPESLADVPEPLTDVPEPLADVPEPLADRPLVQVLIASTRPNRAGEPTARWVAEQAAAAGDFDIEVVDLATIDLPMLAEPGHPNERNYQLASTRAFSEVIDRAAAYVFVMPEYNHSYNAALKNALDHLFWEWRGKPVILVSYGGVAAGARAAAALEPVLISLQLHVVGFVPIPLIDQLLHLHDGRRSFRPTEQIEHSLANALDALRRAMSRAMPQKTV